MNMIKRPGPLRRLFFGQIGLAIFGFAILAALSYPLAKNIGRQYRVNNEVKGLENEIREIESRNLELKGLIDYLGSEEFVQEQARLNLNYRSEGEAVVVISDSDQADRSESGQGSVGVTKYRLSGQTAAVAPREISNPERWWGYFFK